MSIWRYGGHLLICACALGISTSVSAQVASPDAATNLPSTTGGTAPTADWRYSVGLGIGIVPNYEGSDSYKGVPIPYGEIQYNYQFVRLAGLKITSNLINDENWRLGPVLNRRQGYHDVHSDRVDDLTNRGPSTEVGVVGGYALPLATGGDRTAILEVGSEFLADVSSGHDGYLITPFVRYEQPMSKQWQLIGDARFSYASGDYMSHYFSVDRRDSQRSNLSQYNADADIKDVAFSVSSPYAFTQNWSVVPVLMYKRMTGDAKDSPVVDEAGNANQFIAAVVGVYSW